MPNILPTQEESRKTTQSLKTRRRGHDPRINPRLVSDIDPIRYGTDFPLALQTHLGKPCLASVPSVDLWK